MEYIIETVNGYVATIGLIGGELNEVKTYTNDKAQARRFTKKQLTRMLVRSFFRYHSMAIVIIEADATT